MILRWRQELVIGFLWLLNNCCVDGIALSPNCEILVYCALTSHLVYSIDAALLRNFSASLEEIAAGVTLMGDKLSASDGLAYDSKGALYLTSLEGSGVNLWDDGDIATLVSVNTIF